MQKSHNFILNYSMSKSCSLGYLWNSTTQQCERAFFSVIVLQKYFTIKLTNNNHNYNYKENEHCIIDFSIQREERTW